MVQTTFTIQDNKITGVQKNLEELEKITIKKVKTNVTIKYKQKVCKYPGCNNVFTPYTPHQLYCSKECRKYSELDHTVKRVRTYRRKYADILKTLPSNNIGTGGLGEHMVKSFEEEEKKVRQEMKVLGLV